MTSPANDSVSRLVDLVLDISGINQEMKSARKTVSQHTSEICSTLLTSSEIVLTGSAAEGLYPFMRSDFDAMLLHSEVVCVDVPDNEVDINTLQADNRNTPPGYVKVVAVNLGNNRGNQIISKLCSLSSSYGSPTGQPYISSTIFRDLSKKWLELNFDAVSYDNVREAVLTGNGPALNYNTLVGYNLLNNNWGYCINDIDIVHAFNFRGSNTLSDWTSRRRFYDWPPDVLKEEIASMDGYIIPVGEKGSEDQNLEWRISYVNVELKLLSNFNSTQDKLFALLKMLSKEVLTPVCNNFSSYIMKNVVLWMAERNPNSVFQPDFLLDLLLLSLAYMKQCLQNNHLPNYLFPKRNLIAGRIVGQEKKILVSRISALLHEGKSCIARIPRVSEYLNYALICPTTFARYGRWRNDVETLLLLDGCILLLYLDKDVASGQTGITEMYSRHCRDERNWYIQLKLLNLVVPGWIEKVIQGQSYEVFYLLSKRTEAVLKNEMISV